TAWQGNISRAMHDERSFTGIKVIELQTMRLIAVVMRFARQGNVQANTMAASLVSPLVSRFHYAGAATCDHREAGLSEPCAQRFGEFIIFGSRAQAGATKDTHAPTHFLERFRSSFHL